MQDYERLGVFYLGKQYDMLAAKLQEDLLLYDTKDLTTHALIVGMTGSGKTGLGLTMLEEAAIDGIPALIIDPKGDLGNLLLTFPDLKGEDFAPWTDPEEAKREGKSVAEYSQNMADRWKKGLADWGQPPERVKKFKDAVDVAIYTPGSNTGLPLTVLRSFDAPPKTTMDNADAFREAVSAAASSLLGLVGIDADPLRSREHILLSNIFDRSWREGKSLDMAAIIRAIQQPSFDKIGVLDLESFFPSKERFELSMTLNNLLASPGFATWMEGEPLNIQRLLYTAEGKPRLSILSVAHLSDAERMFFITLFLSEVISWMRAQSGTTSLRAILYMDEVFGYFPPSKNPPSKTPMLTLLKQARAYGLGVVLATQNPVDLDYKGLANCGTWFLGRLQTERDKMRVLDGLEGASTEAGMKFERGAMERTLSGVGNRTFLMNNVHEDHPVVFQSRWALSYLRGPLSREQVSGLMASRRAALPASSGTRAAKSLETTSASGVNISASRAVLPPEVTERFVPKRGLVPSGAKLVYRPAIVGSARVHFAQTTSGIDHWENLALTLPLDGDLTADVWSEASLAVDEPVELESKPEEGASFAELAAEMSRAKRYAELSTALKDFLYRTRRLNIWKCADLKEASNGKETQAEFRTRLSHFAREERDAKVEKLRQKYGTKLAAAAELIRKAEARVEKEKTQAQSQMMSTAISIGSAILGAVMGRKLGSATNINKTATSIRSASKVLGDRQDIALATETVEAYQAKLATIEAELNEEIAKLETNLDPQGLALDEVTIQPKKADIAIQQVVLAWTPWILKSDGSWEQV